MSRDWAEIPAFKGEPSVAFAVDKISMVRQNGKGSVIICDGITYHLSAITYESALVLAQFIRAPKQDDLGGHPI